jgi:hypothetical protein
MKSKQMEPTQQKQAAKLCRFGRTLRYEENETLELEYDKEIQFEKGTFRDDPATVGIAGLESDSKSSLNFKKSYKNRLSVRVN